MLHFIKINTPRFFNLLFTCLVFLLFSCGKEESIENSSPGSAQGADLIVGRWKGLNATFRYVDFNGAEKTYTAGYTELFNLVYEMELTKDNKLFEYYNGVKSPDEFTYLVNGNKISMSNDKTGIDPYDLFELTKNKLVVGYTMPEPDIEMEINGVTMGYIRSTKFTFVR